MNLVSISMVIGSIALLHNLYNTYLIYKFATISRNKFLMFGLACILANSVLLYTLYTVS